MLQAGIKGERSVAVTFENSAKALNSGALEVYSTPSLIALMEGAAARSVAPLLEEGHSTVGTRLDIRHLAATPIGMNVRAESELVSVEGRKLVFTVRAYDELQLVGEGTHERFIVENEPFLAKASAKLEKLKQGEYPCPKRRKGGA